MGMTERSFWHPLVLVTFLIAFAFLYFKAPLLFDDLDAPWHLAAGDWILKHGKVPATNIWGHTAVGEKWYNLAWLWEVGASAFVKLTDLQSLRLAGVMWFAATLALLCYTLIQRGLPHFDFVMIILFIALMVHWPSTMVRPQLVTYTLTILLHFWLHKSRAPDAQWLLYLIPFTMLLWANMHGGFLVGFTLLFAYGLEAYISKRREWLKRLVFCTVASLFAVLCTPYSFEIVPAILRTLDSVAQNYIMEWRAFNFDGSVMFSATLLVFILVSNFRLKAAPLADRFIAIIWLLAATQSLRNFFIFILVSAPYLLYCLHAYADILLNKHPALFDAHLRPQTSLRLGLFTLLVVIVLWLPQVRGYLLKDLGLSTRYGEEAVNFALENYPELTYLNDYNLGGYMLFRGVPNNMVFVDGRAGTAYPEKVLTDYINFFGLNEGWQEMLNGYGVQALLLYNSTPFVIMYDRGAFHDEWQRVFHGYKTSVFVRSTLAKEQP